MFLVHALNLRQRRMCVKSIVTLIWEYGRSAAWIEARLPEHDFHDDVERAKQIALFHEGRPSAALKLLNNMRLCQWSWSQDHAIEYADFFLHGDPWETLPPIVRANMGRAIYGLEPAADLKRLRDILFEAFTRSEACSLRTSSGRRECLPGSH